MRTNLKWSLGVSAASLLAAIALATPSASASPYISHNFDTDTSNVAPSGTTYLSAPGSTRAIVVDSSTTTPLDPFGGTGNKSLLLEDNDSGQNSAVAFQGAVAGLNSGTFSATIYAANTTGFMTPQGTVRLGVSNAASTANIGPWLTFESTFAQVVTPGGTLTLDNVLTANTAYNLTLTFDAVAHTFSGTIGPADGSSSPVALSDDSGDTTSFAFRSNVGPITSVFLGGGFVGRTGVRVFFDNVQVSEVPEPASLSLLGLGGLLALRRGRR
jgi:hypothetical protein